MKRFLASLVLLSCTSAFAGPFGLDFGMKAEELENRGVRLEKFNKDASGFLGSFYTLYPSPEINQKIQRLSAFITKKHGLCLIFAYMKEIKTDGYGRELQSEFLAMEKTLDSKYGGNKTKNGYYKEGIEFDKHWLERIADGNANHIPRIIWETGAGKEYPNGLKSVELRPYSTDGVQSGMLQITYTSTQWEACKTEFDGVRTE